MEEKCEVLIVGAGIGGLTLALSLHQAGISCRVYEAVEAIKPLGAGINVLPHAVRVLDGLGLMDTLAATGITTKESIFFNKFGQFVLSEPAGRAAGYDWPQFSIHRGDLQRILLQAVQNRLGSESVLFGHRCTSATQSETGITANFECSSGGTASIQASIIVACDGIHSAIRKQLYPNEGAPRYSGVNMWRGTTPMKPFLSGASMVRAGWLSVGKMVIYPIRDNIDEQGNQLINWVAEIESPRPAQRDWNGAGRLEDFFPAFEDWHFDWLDVAAMIQQTETILEYPMVDQDPLPQWSFGRITLLGDAAHPMVPRGSNGAGQAILDAPCLVQQLKKFGLTPQALAEYDRIRVKATGDVVLMNRVAPPDTILKEVHERTHGKPFKNLDDVISQADLLEISNRYKRVAGFKVEDLRKTPAASNS
ncbi:MAG TPA: flavin-dependent oxidoreductase [Eoetvoesiella sp.]|jgi:2-polyprenyl-6-methoxyphenol hydroxylase-like FAD-dependent oxidoreductase|uniref:flavin-dependent oxidoreductase n=1 Tax=Eoetvoesiella sp. TaxID=1966355 RepID=UPI002CB2E6EC|nr:flavin-dependent oxidoreductase [Eoetvoesiella sp.]HWK61285.1 flavin-dependent oxidoreductase [Eoetvoesiella sp.]